MTTINFNNIDECKNAYMNFYYGGNTKGISNKDIKEIETRYEFQLRGWKLEASKDNNVYEINEDNNEKKHKTSSRSRADLFGAIVTSTGGFIATHAANKAAINGIGNAGCTFVNSAGEQVAAPGASAFGTQTFKAYNPSDTCTAGVANKANNTSAIGFMVECTLGLATGTLYQASNPNKDEHKELMELESDMVKFLSDIDSEQNVMEEDAELLEELSDEAEEIGENSTELLKELKQEYEEKLARQEELAAKIESGEPLTEEEKAEYEQLGEDLSILSEKMANISDDSTDQIEDITEETEEKQGDLETTAETIETIQEKADYAESFDKNTKTMCIMESVAQGLNFVSSTKGAVNAFTFAQSGAMLFGSTLWANAFGIMGVAGAAMSAIGVVEQANMAADINDEIKIRENVQALNSELADAQSETSDLLDEVSDNIDDINSDISNIEFPNDDTVTLNPPVVDDEAPTKPDEEDPKKKEDPIQ